MWRLHVLLAVCLATAGALPQGRIVGGSTTTIDNYPYAAIQLTNDGTAWRQNCGGTIINNRSIMTAAHCLWRKSPSDVRMRIGATFASSGGTVLNVVSNIMHPNFNEPSFMNNDIGIVRVSGAMELGGAARAGSIAGVNFNIADNTLVTAVGWGRTHWHESVSEQLRHVQLRISSQAFCRSTHGSHIINENMFCAGWDTDGRGICSADAGGPLLLNHVTIGVASFETYCGQTRWPGIFTRVSRYTNWILSNA